MPRILKRPMFSRGGSTNENNGIMDGLVDRKGYAEDTGIDSRVVAPTQSEIYADEYYDQLSKIQPPKPRFSLAEFGTNLASGKYAGDGLISSLAGSFKDPYAAYSKADDSRRSLDYNTKMAAAKMGISKADAEAAAKAKALATGKKGMYRILSPEEAKSKLGAAYDPTKAYQQNMNDFKVTPISGSGPTTNLNFPEKQTKYDEDRDKQEAKVYGDIQLKGVEAQNNITNYDLVGALSKNVSSGAYGGFLLNVAKFGKRIGVNTDWITQLDDNGITRLRDGISTAETMEVLQVQFALEKIQKTKGAISDTEFKKFLDTSPGLSMTPRGIEILTTVNKALARRDIEVAQLASEWETNHGRLKKSAETPYGKLTFQAFIAQWKEDPANRVVSEDFLQEIDEISNQGSKDFASKNIYIVDGIKYRKLKDGTVFKLTVGSGS